MSDTLEHLLDNHNFVMIDSYARNISSIRNINCIPRTIIEPSTTVAVENNRAATYTSPLIFPNDIR